MDPGKIFQVYICTIQDMIVYLLVTAKEELLHHLSLLTEGPMDQVTQSNSSSYNYRQINEAKLLCLSFSLSAG